MGTENVELSLVTEQTKIPEAPVAREEDTYLRPQEAAELMKCSRWTVYELVKQNKLTVAHIGNRIRIRKSVVLEFMRNF